jgi:Domain of unknown function (DUF1902)
MQKLTIFTISAAWDDEAFVRSGLCDDIPAAADAPRLDGQLADIEPVSIYLQFNALREAEPAA